LLVKQLTSRPRFSVIVGPLRAESLRFAGREMALVHRRPDKHMAGSNDAALLTVLGVVRVLAVALEIREQACALFLALEREGMALHREHAAHRMSVDITQELRTHSLVTDLSTPLLAEVADHPPVTLGRRLIVLVFHEGGVERALLIHEAGRGACVVHAVVGGLNLARGLADAFEPGALRLLACLGERSAARDSRYEKCC